ncbi:MAG TPA: hypothetical protein VHM72_07650, partial [Solirubrobacteraceae bacterium]|nr:hypothetical protein [Solirubrobacteraceae bacterium]
LGLIAPRRSELHRRSVLVSLTPRGSDLIAERKARYQAHWEEALSRFTADELNIAAAVCDSMCALFGELALEAERVES